VTERCLQGREAKGGEREGEREGKEGGPPIHSLSLTPSPAAAAKAPALAAAAAAFLEMPGCPWILDFFDCRVFLT